VSPFLLALLLQAPPSEEAPGAEPVLNDVVFAGASAYDPQTLRDVLRLRPGQPLRRSPEAAAKVLEGYYRLEGYPAARVSGAFDEATGVLTLTVSEGRLAEVEVLGLSGRAAERAKEALGLEVGKPLREADVWVGLSRLQEEALGALRPEGDPPYSLREDEEGVHLVVRVARDRARVYLRGAGPRNVGRVNRVDGLSPGVRLEVAFSDYDDYNHFRLGVFAAYGFSAQSLRYGIGVARGLGERHKTTWGYEYHDLTDTDDSFRRYGLEEAPGGVINTEQATDYFRRMGHEAFLYRKLGGKLQVGLLLRSDRYSSLPVTTIDPEPPPGSEDYNPPVEEGRMRSFVVSLRAVSHGALFESMAGERRALGQPSLYGTDWFRKPEALRLDATVEVARPSFGSDYDFSRFLGRLRWHLELSEHHAVDAGSLVGLTSGAPPRMKRFALGGLNTLRGYERKQFEGERMALATVEWTVLPGGLWPALLAFWDGGTVWKNAVPDVGWRNDVGVGVRWPPTTRRIFGRLDVAWPLDQLEGHDQGPRYNVRIGIPF
jgi:hypothetical protein